MPRADQAQGEAQPGQPAGDGPGRRRAGRSVVAGQPDESALWDQVSSGEMPPKPEEPLSADEKAMLRRWIERGAAGLARRRRGRPDVAGVGSLGVRAAVASPPAGRPRRPPHPRSGRSLHPAGARGPRADPRPRRRPRHLDPPPDLRPDRPAAVARRDRGVRRRPRTRTPTSGSSIACWPAPDTASAGASTGWMPRATPTPTGTSVPIPTGRWPIAIATTSSARSTPIGRSTRSCREQLAGDELAGGRRGPGTPPEVVDQLVATHFLRNSQDGTGESDGNPDEVRADKYAVLEGTAQIIGSSLLGLTIQCARCHDHKFEPITQEDYYRLQAILYPAFNVEHWVKPNERVVDRRPARRAAAMGGEREGDRRRDRGPAAVVPRRLEGGEEGQGGGAQAGDRGDRGASAAEPRPDRLGRRRLEPTRPRSRSWSGATTPRRGARSGRASRPS